MNILFTSVLPDAAQTEGMKRLTPLDETSPSSAIPDLAHTKLP
jgi:hypothetical protein